MILHNLRKSVESWDMDLMQKSIKMALDAEIPFKDIVSFGLQKGMDTISKRFDEGTIYLPQLVASAKVVDEALRISCPDSADDNLFRGTVVMGSVFGDIHEIGKSICCAMLRGAGFKVIDLGSDVSPEEFAKSASENHADIIGGSALMTTTLISQKRMVETAKEYGISSMLIFGGAPCTEEWVKSIGGDGYSSSASEIIILAKSLIETCSDSSDKL